MVINSHPLYQLSYVGIFPANAGGRNFPRKRGRSEFSRQTREVGIFPAIAGGQNCPRVGGVGKDRIGAKLNKIATTWGDLVGQSRQPNPARPEILAGGAATRQPLAGDGAGA